MSRRLEQTSQERSQPAGMGRDDVDRRPGRRIRPWRAIGTLILACAAAVAVNLYGIPLNEQARRVGGVSLVTGHLVTIVGAIAFVVLGLASTFAWAHWARTGLSRLIGPAYGSIVRYIMILVGLCVVIVATLSMLGFRVGQLVLGGAFTGVLITIAAQQSLSNLFAGVMLQVAQPFKVGDVVRLRSGALGGMIEGSVAEVSITYVTLDTDDGRVLVPNSQVLGAAIMPLHSIPNVGLLAHGLFSRAVPRPPMAHGRSSDDVAQSGAAAGQQQQNAVAAEEAAAAGLDAAPSDAAGQAAVGPDKADRDAGDAPRPPN